MTTNTIDENKNGDGETGGTQLTMPIIEPLPGRPQLVGNDNLVQNAAIMNDNGILNFMSPERVTELYKRIHSQGVPDLEWKFYGRRKPDEPAQETINEDEKNAHIDDTSVSKTSDTNQNEIQPTAFDFDESFSELHVEESIINASLQLKRRSEPGSERKTNLSDIMSDIIKETSQVENE